jgi:hypothetical protein
MRPVLSVFAVAAAVVVTGCSSADPISPGQVTGKWAQPFSVPGSFFEMSLVAAGTDVTGSGRSCGEAGPCSNIVITGTSDASGVQLTLVTIQTVPTQGATATFTFDGKLISTNTLRGTWLQVGSSQIAVDPVVITFQRE